PERGAARGGSVGAWPWSAGAVGIRTRRARPAERPQEGPEPESVDWATRAGPQEEGGDADSIRRQLALPARRVAGWAGTAALMVALWLLIRAFLFQSFYIPSPSMAPALELGDRVLVRQLSYHLHGVHRGDIVV